MEQWIERVPSIDWALGGMLLLAALAALVLRPRGGRFRALPGWVLLWLAFTVVLVCLSLAPVWVSMPLLGLTMFAGLREYFFIVPLRPQDRYAVLSAYLAIPFALYPAFADSYETFAATVPIALFLLFPVLLSFAGTQPGLLESMGRILLGVLLYVFCAAHVGLLTHWPGSGLPELFGILVLGADTPQRLLGRFGSGSGWVRPPLGVLAGLVVASALGYWLGPWCGLVEEDGARAGLLVGIAVGMGSMVTHAVLKDLSLASSATRLGRAAFLDRSIPAVYAAPVFFHYLNHFA